MEASQPASRPPTAHRQPASVEPIHRHQLVRKRDDLTNDEGGACKASPGIQHRKGSKAEAAHLAKQLGKPGDHR